MQTISRVIFIIFGIVAAGLLLAYLIRSLPGMGQDRIELPVDDRGLFGTNTSPVCENQTIVCVDPGVPGLGLEQRRCDASLALILCHQRCPCP